MVRIQQALFIAFPIALLAAADQQPWKDKQMTQWSAEDAKQVMTDSPWAKQVTPRISSKSESGRGGRGGGGRRGGMGGGGIGLGIPGVGIGMPGGGGRRGGGYPQGGGYPGGGGYPPQGGNPQDDSRYPQDDSRYPRDGSDDRRGNSGDYREPPTLTVRWESALPIQQAELKSKDVNAPSIDENHYAIAVVGLPARLARDPQMTESKLKGQAELKRDGKKFSKPSDVKVISRDEGLIVIYYFPRSKEIRATDHDIEFAAHVGRFELSPAFDATEMKFLGKLEL